MKLDSKLVMLRGGENGSKFMSCLSKKNYDNKNIKKNLQILASKYQT